MHASLKRPVRLTLVSALLAGLGAHAAAAEPFLLATSSLSALGFQLIDLNPDDGIAPSLTLLTDGGLYTTTLTSDSMYGGWGEDVVTVVPLTGSTSGSPLPAFTQGNPSQGFNATATSLSTSAQLSASDLRTWSTTSTQDYIQGPTIATVTGVSTYNGGGNLVRFDLQGESNNWNPDTGSWSSTISGRLSANTALVITGQARLNLRADNSALVESMNGLASGENAFITSNSGSVNGQISLSLRLNSGSNDATSSAYSTSSSYFDMGDGVFFDANGLTRANPISGVTEPIDGLVAELSTSKNFSLVAFNSSDNISDLAFGMFLSSGVDQMVGSVVNTTVVTDNPNWVPGPITPTIPEPSTYALMGLGLVGLSLVARRQRTRNT